jgi:hypothetical protein
MDELLKNEYEIISFKMYFDSWLDGWSYVISDSHIKEIHASDYFQSIKKHTRKLKEYKLTLDLIKKLEEIKDKYDMRSCRRIYEVKILLENY